MEEKQLMRQAFLFSISFSLLGFAICIFIFNDMKIALGFPIGTVVRLAGLLQIIKMVNRLDCVPNPRLSGSSNYVVRLLFYGIVIAISVSRGVSILTLLFGFLCVNAALHLVTYLHSERRVR